MENSIFLIGLTGVGKTTTGQRLSRLLDWKFIDLDAELEDELGMTCPDIIRKFGWAEFRDREAQALERLMKTHQRKHVVSCGGGVVETQRARALLAQWHAQGIVLLVRHPDVGELVSELKTTDKRRMVSKENLEEIFQRRTPWLEECSNCCYINTRRDSDHDGIPIELQDFLQQLHSICGATEAT
ncbi:hypothetical protein SUNI508_11961 [Seiridium unicorne]|uniref:shikimate kinase n=1 Tax=Seiridium unicorne TaxID=138068 RepID=A0ABR2UEX9_9PEZI